MIWRDRLSNYGLICAIVIMIVPLIALWAFAIGRNGINKQEISQRGYQAAVDSCDLGDRVEILLFVNNKNELTLSAQHFRDKDEPMIFEYIVVYKETLHKKGWRLKEADDE